MRIRSIKPEFFMHEELAELSPAHRLLFIGLWTLADRDGRLEDRPKRIKAQLFPWDQVDVDAMLSDLDAAGFVQRYEVDGFACVSIPGFGEHQRPHPKETSFQLPAPPAVKKHGKPEKETASREKESACRVVVGGGYGGGSRNGDPDAVASAAQVEVEDQDKPRSKPKTEKPPASRHAVTVSLLVETWKSTVGTAYPFQGGRDGTAVSKLLTYPDATDEEIRRRFAVYLADPFHVKQSSLAHFVSKWAGCVEAPAARRARDPRFGSARAEDQHHPAAPGPMWFPGDDPALKPEGTL